LQSDYKGKDFFATVIAEGVNFTGHDYVNSSTFSYFKQMKSDTSFETQSTFYNYYEGSSYAKLYRLYGGYEDEKNRVIVGVQNIQMGVGRIWTPVNLFNPKNIYALEPDEVFGVVAVSYTRHLDETSDVMVVSSQKRDKSLKYGAQYKAFRHSPTEAKSSVPKSVDF
jgi:hypothetical protein